ncbi:zinc finger protein 2-like [Asparagus officinalis]|uniref:zinc finger protein 2-like n=1 Tax=Asparagus officinalis TaxID=4686 RepID=UPI00098E790B|nr:zinc finger protein 2-like [Asparagus officinalis]
MSDIGGRVPTDSKAKTSSPHARHVCSFCQRCFPTLQALGGHQTAHRKEIEVMRREHKAIVESEKVDSTGPALVTLDLLDRCEGKASPSSGFDQVQDEDNGGLNLDLTLKL